MKVRIIKTIYRFKYALLGIHAGICCDSSFRIQVIGGAATLALLLFLFAPLTQLELILFFLAWALVLITELQNSAFEEALDHLHPEQHDRVGRSKDMASGAVLIAGLFAFGVVCFIAISHLWV